MAHFNSIKAAHIPRRFERFISAIVVRPFLSKYVKMGTILSYHNITSVIEESNIQPDSVTLAEFERQMLFLVTNHFNIIPLQKLVRDLAVGEQIQKKTVVITFDDGYKTTFSNALPILQKYDIPATVFLAVDYIGDDTFFPWLESSHNSDNAEDLAPMDWEEVKELVRAGIEIGSHTCSHAFLPKMASEAIQKELIDSAAAIKNMVGEPPRTVALPFSFPIKHAAWPHFQSALKTGLAQGGYTSCCTSCRGRIASKSDPYMLPRVFIDKYDDVPSFHLKVIGAYVWTRLPQYLYQKFFKNYHKLTRFQNTTVARTIS